MRIYHYIISGEKYGPILDIFCAGPEEFYSEACIIRKIPYNTSEIYNSYNDDLNTIILDCIGDMIYKDDILTIMFDDGKNKKYLTCDYSNFEYEYKEFIDKTHLYSNLQQ